MRTSSGLAANCMSSARIITKMSDLIDTGVRFVTRLEPVADDGPEIVAAYDIARREFPVSTKTDRERIGDRHARLRSGPQQPIALVLDASVSPMLRRELP